MLSSPGSAHRSAVPGRRLTQFWRRSLSGASRSHWLATIRRRCAGRAILPSEVCDRIRAVAVCPPSAPGAVTTWRPEDGRTARGPRRTALDLNRTVCCRRRMVSGPRTTETRSSDSSQSSKDAVFHVHSVFSGKYYPLLPLSLKYYPLKNRPSRYLQTGWKGKRTAILAAQTIHTKKWLPSVPKPCGTV